METPLPADVRPTAMDGTSQLDRVQTYGPAYLAIIVAWTATLGSLYFSEVRGYVPCELCWYQRILMYPLAVLVPLGVLRRDRDLPFYALPLVLIGAPISLYHILLQKTDWFDNLKACSAAVPCNQDWIYWFGWVTIPVLALTAFVLIGLSLSAARHDAESSWAAPGPVPWRAVLLAIGAVVAFFATIIRLGL
jgi:disulfide bond formation protein DsbB